MTGDRRLVMLCALAVSLATGSRAARAQEYICPGTQDYPHCYAYYTWFGPANGAALDISVPRWGAVGEGTDGHTNWEMWLAQETTSAAFWVEAGVTSAYQNCGNVQCNSNVAPGYFWADWRPGSIFYAHFISRAAANDQVAQFQIYIDGSNTWKVTKTVVQCASGCNGGNCSANYSSHSTSNSMVPNRIRIGSELIGTYGQPRAKASFTKNYWLSTSTNRWYPQGGLGNPGSACNEDRGSGWCGTGPEWGHWHVLPTSSNEGGLWWSESCLGVGPLACPF